MSNFGNHFFNSYRGPIGSGVRIGGVLSGRHQPIGIFPDAGIGEARGAIVNARYRGWGDLGDNGKPRNWTRWTMEHIGDEQNHAMLRAALREEMQNEAYHDEIENLFVLLHKMNTWTPVETGIVKEEREVEEILRIEDNLREQLAKVTPKLMKDLAEMGKNALDCLAEGMGQMCCAAERIIDDTDKGGLEQRVLNHFTLSDASYALEVGELWIQLSVDEVERLHAESENLYNLKNSEIVQKSRHALQEINADIESQRARIEVCERALSSQQDDIRRLDNAMETLRRKKDARSCLSGTGDIDQMMSENRRKVEADRQRIYEGQREIADRRRAIGQLESLQSILNQANNVMGDLSNLKSHLAANLVDFKKTLKALRDSIALLLNAEIQAETAALKKRIAVGLLEAAEQSLFCHQLHPYVGRLIDLIAQGYEDSQGPPPEVQTVLQRLEAEWRADPKGVAILQPANYHMAPPREYYPHRNAAPPKNRRLYPGDDVRNLEAHMPLQELRLD